MSEQGNIRRVGLIHEAFRRGDIDCILDQLDDEVRWVSHFEPEVPWSGEYPGKRNVTRFFLAIGKALDVIAFLPGELVAQGRTVVSLDRLACRVHATGKSAVARWVFVWRFRAGQVWSVEQFDDPTLADAFR
jgi:ketosteroid isomerase-like protein